MSVALGIINTRATGSISGAASQRPQVSKHCSGPAVLLKADGRRCLPPTRPERLRHAGLKLGTVSTTEAEEAVWRRACAVWVPCAPLEPLVDLLHHLVDVLVALLLVASGVCRQVDDGWRVDPVVHLMRHAAIS